MTYYGEGSTTKTSPKKKRPPGQPAGWLPARPPARPPSRLTFYTLLMNGCVSFPKGRRTVRGYTATGSHRVENLHVCFRINASRGAWRYGQEGR